MVLSFQPRTIWPIVISKRTHILTQILSKNTQLIEII